MDLVLESLAKIVFMFLLIMGMVPVLIWAERKGAAYIQDRTGPNRASIGGVRLAGLVHPIADVLKLVFKEDVAPTGRHRALYNLAPWLVMTIALSTYAVIPFGDYLEIGGRRIPLVVADLQVGLLYVLAVASLGTYGIVLAGWAANNKFTFLGGIRATAQMISYEISMGLAMMGLMLDLRHPAPDRHRRRARASCSSASCRCGASSCSRWASCCSSPRSTPRPTATRSTCPRASRRSSPATTSSTAR